MPGTASSLPGRRAQHENAKYTYDDSPIVTRSATALVAGIPVHISGTCSRPKKCSLGVWSVMHNLVVYNKLTEKIRDALFGRSWMLEFCAEYCASSDEKI